jgi:hypothetical protein
MARHGSAHSQRAEVCALAFQSMSGVNAMPKSQIERAVFQPTKESCPGLFASLEKQRRAEQLTGVVEIVRIKPAPQPIRSVEIVHVK